MRIAHDDGYFVSYNVFTFGFRLKLFQIIFNILDDDEDDELFEIIYCGCRDNK